MSTQAEKRLDFGGFGRLRAVRSVSRFSFPLLLALATATATATASQANAEDYVELKQYPFYPGANAAGQLLAHVRLTSCCGDDDPDIARVFRLAKKAKAEGWKDVGIVHAASTTIEVSFRGKTVKMSYGSAELSPRSKRQWDAILLEVRRLTQLRLSASRGMD